MSKDTKVGLGITALIIGIIMALVTIVCISGEEIYQSNRAIAHHSHNNQCNK